MYRVTREFKFCFGHRLLDYPGKCRQLHGHNARVHLTIAARRLDALGMAMDFAAIKRIVSRWIDDELDHKTILHRQDPLFAKLERMREPVLGVDFNPTTENLAKFIYDHACSEGVPVVEAVLWENDASCASYTPDGFAAATFGLDEELENHPTTAPASGGRQAVLGSAAAPMPASTGGLFFVTREIKFCFGHRLMNYPGKCRQIHGHNGRLLLTVEAAALDPLGMATDFGEIKRSVQQWIDSEWDHSMLLHHDDPLVPVLREFDCRVVEFDDNPTTENLAKRIYQKGVSAGLAVSQVQLWETDSCSAGYIAEVRNLRVPAVEKDDKGANGREPYVSAVDRL